MKHFLIPSVLLAHALCNLCYFFDPEKVHWLSQAWATYFHCIQAFFLFTYCMVFAGVRRKAKYDNHFLIIEASYNIILCLSYELNYKGYWQHTYGLIITSIALAFSVILSLRIGVKYEYLN